MLDNLNTHKFGSLYEAYVPVRLGARDDEHKRCPYSLLANLIEFGILRGARPGPGLFDVVEFQNDLSGQVSNLPL